MATEISFTLGSGWRMERLDVYKRQMFPDPSVKQWFADHGGCIDDDQYALSNMLQWIWRSAIRNNIPVKLYIPSRRMRGILKAWLEITSDSLELPESA